MDSKTKIWARAAGLITACVFLIYGLHRGEAVVVLNKAVNICLECIGLG